MIEGGIVKKR